ncbi:unnamed protein product [Phyllotreta striolata]|uniref:Carboxylic ester hydrolase n=1 Tax=Phyllotreta striolata TaxID=444603 RepID=A0A9N9TPW2_PHYSR|nr:unnamed protein product [Phyllotreta striolata]
MEKFLLLLCCFSAVFGDGTIVQLPNGKIQGKIAYTYINKIKFWAFQGIPYAAPPVGKNRFQPPQPVDNWNGTRAATHSPICYQTGLNHKDSGEDCLYLHVYTPKEPGTNSSLPVMLNIHGGTYRRGAGFAGYIQPQYLMEHNVVIVSINYRLGPFGFLSTGDKIIPGNMGLKDQQYAIKWTKNNIHLFGGDPNKITIMGQSAGSASVTYHLLSRSSSGLFRAAIAQSGSALNTWAFQRHPVDTAYGIAAMIDPNFSRNKSTQELSDVLMNAGAEAIHATGSKYSTFAPVLEVEHDGAFITESMYQKAADGEVNKVPYLGGICSEEGIIVATNIHNWEKIVKKFDDDARNLVDEDMYIDDDSKKLEAGNAIKKIFTNGSLLDHIGSSVQYQTDNRYVRAPIKFAELVSEYIDVYFYQFSYHGKLGKNTHLIEGIGKVGHGEDLNYLWAGHKTFDGFPESDVLTVRRYVGLLTNFAKYLNPLPEKSDLFQNLTLPKFTKTRKTYLDIDKDLTIKENPREFSFQKWVDVFEKYAKKPLISF